MVYTVEVLVILASTQVCRVWLQQSTYSFRNLVWSHLFYNLFQGIQISFLFWEGFCSFPKFDSAYWMHQAAAMKFHGLAHQNIEKYVCIENNFILNSSFISSILVILKNSNIWVLSLVHISYALISWIWKADVMMTFLIPNSKKHFRDLFFF